LEYRNSKQKLPPRGRVAFCFYLFPDDVPAEEETGEETGSGWEKIKN
jgi:hypothetical protein